jgi:excisionase family DNA binding protein
MSTFMPTIKVKEVTCRAKKMKKEERITFENCLDIMTIKEVASLLTVSERMVNKLVSDDRIKSFWIGRARRFTKNQVREFVFEQSDDESFIGIGKTEPEEEEKPVPFPYTGMADCSHRQARGSSQIGVSLFGQAKCLPRSHPKLLPNPLLSASKCTFSAVENLSTQVFHSNAEKTPCKMVPLHSAAEKD